MTFADLKIGAKFTCNGVPYVKKSSRTAYAGLGHPAHGRWFYFGQKERVTV